MPWTKRSYPRSMQNLPVTVRNKAVEIANALVEEEGMEEGVSIATAISRAKDWAANRGKATDKKNVDSKRVDVKKHGEDRYVTPGDDGGWAVKKEKGGRSQHFESKEEAVRAAKEQAKKFNAAVTMQGKDGRLQTRVSYNPNRRFPRQTSKTARKNGGPRSTDSRKSRTSRRGRNTGKSRARRRTAGSA